jgi:hypothetical protein
MSSEATPDSAAFGPNGDAVAAVITRAQRLTPDEVEALAAAWRVVRVDAWVITGSAARAAGRSAALDAARSAAWRAVPAAPVDAVDAADAAWCAVSAEVVRDLITPEQYEALAGPWNSVMEKYARNEPRLWG